MNNAMMKKHSANADSKTVDFGGTWKKLLGYCKKYWIVMILALAASVAGTILTLLGRTKSPS